MLLGHQYSLDKECLERGMLFFKCQITHLSDSEYLCSCTCTTQFLRPAVEHVGDQLHAVLGPAAALGAPGVELEPLALT